MKSVCLATAVLILAAMAGGCDEETRIIEGPSVLTLTAIPNPAASGEMVVVAVAASSPRSITASRMDFESDGGWDATQSHVGNAVSTTYAHAYKASGDFEITAQILEGAAVLASATATVTVTSPVVLAITSLANPPVTAELQGESCTLQVQDWTGIAMNTVLREGGGSPFHDLVLETVTIAYDWLNGTTSTPTRVVGLSDLTIPPAGSASFSFAPIAFQDLTPEVIGNTANLALVFNARTVEGDELHATVQRQLFVEACPVIPAAP